MRLPTPPASSTTATSAAAVGAALAAQRRGAMAGRGARATKAPHDAMSSAKSSHFIVTQIALACNQASPCRGAAPKLPFPA